VTRRGFILDLLAQLGTTSNYSAIADLHRLHITTGHAKSFPASCIYTSRSLVTTSNSRDPSASALKSALNNTSFPTDIFFHRLPYGTESVAAIVFLLTPRHGPRRKHHFRMRICFRGNVFTEPFPSSVRLFLHIKKLLPSNERCSIACFATVA
jgi:hypothetical protein